MAFLVAAGLLPSCLVPPNIDPPDANVLPFLFIDKGKADPKIVFPVVVPRETAATQFDVIVALEVVGISRNALHYNWYYDYVKGSGGGFLDQFIVCGASTDRCLLSPCNRPGSSVDNHRLTLVVSDLPLRVTDDQGHDPFDFPAGAHFDSVTWDIELVGGCPGK